MLSPKKKEPKEIFKSDGVTIKSMNTVAMPTPMGQINFSIFGLGDDDKVYQYNGTNQKWILVQR